MARNIMAVLWYVVCCCMIITSKADGHLRIDEAEQHLERDRRIDPATIIGALSIGASLAGTTVGALMDKSYGVAVSGSVENYSKWSLVSEGCEIKSGYMNEPMRTVHAGMREGFASHKTGHTATGSWVKCSFSVGSRRIHLMYEAPYDFNFHDNQLAIAVCATYIRRCTRLTANDMYYGSYWFMKRASYEDRITPLKICRWGLCVRGVMGTSHHPTVSISVLPEDYENLSTAAKSAAAKERWTAAEYFKYVHNSFRG